MPVHTHAASLAVYTHAVCMPCVRYAYMSELARAVDVEREELLLEQVDGVLVDLVADMGRGRRG